MVMVLQEWQVLAIVGFSALMFIGALVIFVQLRNNCPDAFIHWKAIREGKNICRVHYRGRKCEDYIAEVDKAEKDMGTPYWTVQDIGIKFKPGPEDIEFIEGSIPTVNYYENAPAAIKVSEATAYSQLKDHFKKIGIPIEGVEKAAFYVLSDSEKLPKDRAINNARIDSAETRSYIKKFLDTVENNRRILTSMKLESGVFTWQTAMKALDDTIAYTSANIAHTKEVIRAAILRQEDQKRKDFIMWAIIAFILCIGAASFIIAVK